MSKKILLIGCGQLGSRHLQALSMLDIIAEIVVVDPSEQALALGRQRLQEQVGRHAAIRYQWLQKLPQEGTFDLCIIATLAQRRKQFMMEVLHCLKVRYFLLEKIVVQSVEDYQQILEATTRAGIKVWVNCKTRAYKIHQYIKSKLDCQQPLSMSVVAGNHGLATNGIHEVDLFFYYQPGSVLKTILCAIDPVLHSSKRGADLYELSGLIAARDEQGNNLTINFQKHQDSPDVIVLSSAKCRFVVDHYRKLCLESYADNDWVWNPVVIDEHWQVSVMTQQFAEEILLNGKSLLPTLQEHQAAHHFIINTLKSHFEQRGINCVQGCPVT